MLLTVTAGCGSVGEGEASGVGRLAMTPQNLNQCLTKNVHLVARSASFEVSREWQERVENGRERGRETERGGEISELMND